jgi:hypothetical protein
MIVPGGGLSTDGTRWVGYRPGFFLPVRVVSRLFRRPFLTKLAAAHAQGRLDFYGELKRLTNQRAFASFVKRPRRAEWVTYAKAPFAGPKAVLAYLSRYTHRIAISNRRLVALDDVHVAFTWRDYGHGRARKIMRLDAHEFLRRFLLHVLPDGFQRIRHYGFLANGHRQAKLAAIRSLLAFSLSPTAPAADDTPTTREPGEPGVPCPCFSIRLSDVNHLLLVRCL